MDDCISSLVVVLQPLCPLQIPQPKLGWCCCSSQWQQWTGDPQRLGSQAGFCETSVVWKGFQGGHSKEGPKQVADSFNEFGSVNGLAKEPCIQILIEALAGEFGTFLTITSLF